MRILIASGIFPPEPGGPATYVKKLAEEIVLRGHKVVVLAYSDLADHEMDKKLNFPVYRIKRKNFFSNYLRYFWRVVAQLKDHDLIYAFDYFSAGLPAVLAAKFFRKKIVVRTGGDLIWERYLSQEQTGISLKDFYEKKYYRKSWLKFMIAKLVFLLVDKIVFSTRFQGEIFSKYYSIPMLKIVYIGNPIPEIKVSPPRQAEKNIIWAGRMVAKNNVRNLVKAFSNINDQDFNLILYGDGDERSALEKLISQTKSLNIQLREKLGHDELMTVFSQSFGVVLPSYTDISPNTALECLALGVPFVITQEHGFDWLKGKVLEFDPNDLSALEIALRKLMATDYQAEFTNMVAKIDYRYSFKELTDDTLVLFEGLIKRIENK